MIKNSQEYFIVWTYTVQFIIRLSIPYFYGFVFAWGNELCEIMVIWYRIYSISMTLISIRNLFKILEIGKFYNFVSYFLIWDVFELLWIIIFLFFYYSFLWFFRFNNSLRRLLKKILTLINLFGFPSNYFWMAM